MSDAFETAACGLLVTDRHGEIERANETLCRCVGFSMEALLGRKFQDLLTVGSKLFHHTQWMPLLQLQGSIAEVQLELVTQGGRVLPVLVNAASRPAPDLRVDIAVMVVTDRRKYERQLLEARRNAEQLLVSECDAREAAALALRRLESFVLGAPFAIAVLKGSSLSFDLVNERFSAVTGGRATLGIPARAALGLAESSTLWTMVSTSYESGTTSVASDYISELSHHRQDDTSEVHLDVVVQPTVAAGGGRDGVIVYLNDVSERAAARFRLEEKNRELDSFAYIASHDLKAPLRGIGNLATFIQEEDGERLSPASVKHLQMMQARVTHMRALIDGVLQFARAGSREEARVEVEVDVHELVGQIVDVLALPATVKIELGTPMPTLLTSRIALEQVLLNLVSNAVKHAERADPVVKIDAAEQGARYVFSVADNGPGIAPQHHERVWKLFQALSPTRDGDSTGIGLAIVRKVVESRGGKVWIESVVGHGATFFFTWPKDVGRTS